VRRSWSAGGRIVEAIVSGGQKKACNVLPNLHAHSLQLEAPPPSLQRQVHLPQPQLLTRGIGAYDVQAREGFVGSRVGHDGGASVTKRREKSP
jgi:hypothetical protein